MIDGDGIEIIMSEFVLPDNLEDTCTYCDKRAMHFRPDDDVALCYKHRYLWLQAEERGIGRDWIHLVMMGHEAQEK